MNLAGAIQKFTETKAEPFTLADFAAWLATKPRDETYVSRNPRSCALGQYTRHLGGNVAMSERGYFYFARGVLFPVVGEGPIYKAAYQWPGTKLDDPKTFGAAHDRALKFLSADTK